MKNKSDYTEKKVFIGIDVHKKTYSVAAVCDGELMKKDTIKAKPENLSAY